MKVNMCGSQFGHAIRVLITAAEGFSTRFHVNVAQCLGHHSSEFPLIPTDSH
jgi:hypothetical protein